MTFISVTVSSFNNSNNINNNHTNDALDKNCTWKYYCIRIDRQKQCTELSKPEIECIHYSTLEDNIIDVATRCPPGQAHDFRGKCRKIFT